MCTHIHTHIHTNIHTNTPTHTPTHTYTYTHTPTHTYTYTYTYTHTCCTNMITIAEPSGSQSTTEIIGTAVPRKNQFMRRNSETTVQSAECLIAFLRSFNRDMGQDVSKYVNTFIIIIIINHIASSQGLGSNTLYKIQIHFS